MKERGIHLIKIIAVALVIGAFTFALAIDCGIGGGGGPQVYVKCDILQPASSALFWLLFLVVVILIFTVIKGVTIYRNAILLILKVLVLLSTAILLSDYFASDYQKVVYVGGMTYSSCADGRSIYPWGVSYIESSPSSHKRYKASCYFFHKNH